MSLGLYSRYLNQLLAILFLTGFVCFTNAQENINKKQVVGFACYFDGKPSKTVEKYTLKLENKKYQWISRRLDSDNNAEKYLSVLSLENLSNLGNYKLSKKEIAIIQEVKNSKELVSVCSGCSYFQKVCLKDMFTVEMRTMSTNWLKNILK
ncbi:hypothetical protein [Patiriisocius marinus]|uniref:Uncharacterized protein n=1 Tax=Patiriisocius marinus TaxID=1397112 RepID=A0A5J4J545_9FLAO|nr:hypothetical protein [Patiriisocius marinus]GER60911.1 hypothetical protein ULMA_30190 [Patiriisocius marinus]